jgi:hypothetical protein
MKLLSVLEFSEFESRDITLLSHYSLILVNNDV